MGCFDTIIFEKPFKCSICGREIKNCQTKELGEALVSYVITKDNRFRENWKRWQGEPGKEKQSSKYRFIDDIGFDCYDYCSQATDNKCEVYHSFYIIVMDGKIVKIKHSEAKF